MTGFIKAWLADELVWLAYRLDPQRFIVKRPLTQAEQEYAKELGEKYRGADGKVCLGSNPMPSTPPSGFAIPENERKQ